MTWCNSFNDVRAVENNLATAAAVAAIKKQQHQQQASSHVSLIRTCPACGHHAQYDQLQATATIQDLPGLPAGVKFDPTDQELLEHLEGKARPDTRKLHPLIDEFIPTIEGENGICYTHPEKLPVYCILEKEDGGNTIPSDVDLMQDARNVGAKEV